jgi:hypothetical protein
MYALLAIFLIMMAYSHILATGTGDVPLFIEKMNIAANQGIYVAFASQPAREYPPFASALLLLGKCIANTFQVDDFTGFKVLIFLFYIFSALMLGLIAQSLLVACVFLFSMFLSSIFFGYLDILCAPFIYFGLYLIDKRKLSIGLLFFTVSCLIKWQLVIFYPFVLLYAFTPFGFLQGLKLLCNLRFWIAFSPSFLLILLCHIYFGENFFGSLIAATEHGKLFLAPNGLNLAYLSGSIYREFMDIGNIFPNTTAIVIGDHRWIFRIFRSLFIFSYIMALLMALSIERDNKRVLLIGVGAFWSYVALSTGVHENHIVMAVLLSLFVVGKLPSAWPLAVISASMLNFNLALFYLSGRRSLTQSVDHLYLIGALIAVLAYLWVVIFCLNSLSTPKAVNTSNLFLGIGEGFAVLKKRYVDLYNRLINFK